MIVDAAALAIFSISLVELALPLSVTSSGCCPADKISHYMAIQYALKVFEYEGKRSCLHHPSDMAAIVALVPYCRYIARHGQ